MGEKRSVVSANLSGNTNQADLIFIMPMHKNIYILCDIEGSSLCRDYESTKLMGKGWPGACIGMTLDVNAVVKALFNAGAEKITIKDFHRSGYNIFTDLIDNRARVVSGYAASPIPGIGSTYGATGLMMIGMHAASGSTGFLPHTLTSKISKLRVNGQIMSEAQLFSAVLARKNLIPLFFSGCPDACVHASRSMADLHTFPLDKTRITSRTDISTWRSSLAEQAVRALSSSRKTPFYLDGPFLVELTMRDGPDAARKICRRWGYQRKWRTVLFQAPTIEALYMELIKSAYLIPAALKLLPAGLYLYHLIGRAGRILARRQVGNGLSGEPVI